MSSINLINILIIILSFGHKLSSDRKPHTDRTDMSFLRECLFYHNMYRRRHDSPILLLDKNLINYSMKRVANVSRFGGLKYGHKDLNDTVGENIYHFVGGPFKMQCQHAIQYWYNEIKMYDFSKNEFNSKTGHFTQMVWAGTTKVGCARTLEKRGLIRYEIFVVCNYRVPGNIIGAFDKNVRKTMHSAVLENVESTIEKGFKAFDISTSKISSHGLFVRHFSGNSANQKTKTRSKGSKSKN